MLFCPGAFLWLGVGRGKPRGVHIAAASVMSLLLDAVRLRWDSMKSVRRRSRRTSLLHVKLEQFWTPAPKDAQQTAVVRLPQFFSAEEVGQILALSDSVPIHRLLRDEQWETRYLHADGRFSAALPLLQEKLLAAAHAVDTEQGWNLMHGRSIGLRLVEMHRVSPSMESSLLHSTHYDRDSLLTLDLMLQPAAAGGVFETLEPNGKMRKHAFELGDLLVFVSHKYHCVSGVQEGTRCVMVVELWEGESKRCAHRCDARFGTCERGENEPN